MQQKWSKCLALHIYIIIQHLSPGGIHNTVFRLGLIKSCELPFHILVVIYPYFEDVEDAIEYPDEAEDEKKHVKYYTGLFRSVLEAYDPLHQSPMYTQVSPLHQVVWY